MNHKIFPAIVVFMSGFVCAQAQPSKNIQTDSQGVEKKIEKKERPDAVNAKADADWNRLITLVPTQEELKKIGSNNVAYQLIFDRYMRERIDHATRFWKTYPKDKRRLDALYILLNADAQVLMPWIGELNDSLATRLKAMEDSLRGDYFRYRTRKLYYSNPYFRSFPRNLIARDEWINTGDELVRQAKLSLAATDKMEELDWAVFCRNWRVAGNEWRNMPKTDERPDDRIKELEKDYWKNMADLFWKLYWVRFSEHVGKYADLPVLEKRAMDFLSGMNFHEPDLAKKYWANIIKQFGDPAYQHARKKGVKALYKAALNQLSISKMEQKLEPVQMKFTAMDGRQIDLAKYRGKIVLIDFWATWCKPCVAEMPVLKSVYDKYRDKGFEVIGICLDDESQRTEVKKILGKSGLSVPQRFEGKGFDGDYYRQLFGITALPTAWLIDKNGFLVSTNARGNKLETLLRLYL